MSLGILLLLADVSSPPQVYSSSEFLAANSNLSLSSSSDRSHSEDKEERWDRHSGDEDRSRLAGTEPRCVPRQGMHQGFVPASRVCAGTPCLHEHRVFVLASKICASSEGF